MPSAADALDTPLTLACALAALAGAVDAIAVTSFGGVFVSFMSGNTTRLGIAVADGQWSYAMTLGWVASAFVAGVIAGEMLAVQVDPRRRAVVVPLVVALGLGAVAVLVSRGAGQLAVAASLAALMGVQNAAVRRAGGTDVAVTYVSGTLVRFGRAFAAALLGRSRWRAAAPFAALWVAFAAGALAGGVVAALDATAAIAAAAACAALVAAIAAIRPSTPGLRHGAAGNAP